jgi:hypothetical protein
VCRRSRNGHQTESRYAETLGPQASVAYVVRDMVENMDISICGCESIMACYRHVADHANQAIYSRRRTMTVGSVANCEMVRCSESNLCPMRLVGRLRKWGLMLRLVPLRQRR